MSRRSLDLNNGCALRCCSVALRKVRDVVEMLVEARAWMSNDLLKDVRSAAGLFDCGEL